MRTSLRIAPGLVTDDTTFAASGAWTNGGNVRFWRNLPQVIGGWTALVGESLNGVCRAALSWNTGGAGANVALGTNTKLYIAQSGSLFDITPTTFVAGSVDGTGGSGFGLGGYGEGGFGADGPGDYFPLTWTFATWGSQLIANPRGQTLFLWENNTATKAAALSNAPAVSTCVLVAPNRQVHAFGCTQVNGTYNGLCIRGSDLRNNNLWAPAPDNNSFEVILEGGGRIVLALNIGNYEVVWTTQGLHLGTPTGAPNQPYSYAPVPGSVGLIGSKAAVVIGSSAYWVGTDSQFYRYDLGGSISPIVCPIRDDFADHIAVNQTDKIQLSFISEFAELWCDYPDDRDGMENSRSIFLNLLDGVSWSKGLEPRSCRIFAQPQPIGVAPTGEAYIHEVGQDANGAPLKAFLESADQFLSEEQVLMLRSVWPDIQSQVGAVSLSIITRYVPQGDETVHGPFTMAPSEDKVDFRATGRLIRFRLESNSSPSFWRLGRPVIDSAQAGTR